MGALLDTWQRSSRSDTSAGAKVMDKFDFSSLCCGALLKRGSMQ